MAKKKKRESDHLAETLDKLVSAALPHVVFDGWGAETLRAAMADADVDASLARLACPRGGLDLAVAFHRQGDAAMVRQLQAADQTTLRFRDRISAAVHLRLDVVASNKDAVRRGVALFSMPHHAAEGATLIWATCDLIWTQLGDTSADVNWYTKRASLSAVYSATVLFWLGDDSDNHQDTTAFLDRRIENIMQIERFKAKLRENPLFKGFMSGPGRILDRIHAPTSHSRNDLPGYVSKST